MPKYDVAPDLNAMEGLLKLITEEPQTARSAALSEKALGRHPLESLQQRRTNEVAPPPTTDSHALAVT